MSFWASSWFFGVFFCLVFCVFFRIELFKIIGGSMCLGEHYEYIPSGSDQKGLYPRECTLCEQNERMFRIF